MPKGERSARTDIVDADVVALYRQGLTSYQIAHRLKISPPTVIYRLKRSNEPRRTRWDNHCRTHSKREVATLYAKGLASTQIATTLGITPASVRSAVLQSGGTMRPKTHPPVAHGKDNASWSGGRFTNKDGYVMVHVGHGRRHAFEHRVVMSLFMGRPLTRNEIVHHLNGIRDDNRLDNLVVTTRKDHEHYTYVKALQARIRTLEQLIQKMS